MLLIKYNLSGKKWISLYISPILCTLIHFSNCKPHFHCSKYREIFSIYFVKFYQLNWRGYRLTNEFSWSGSFLFAVLRIKSIRSKNVIYDYRNSKKGCILATPIKGGKNYFPSFLGYQYKQFQPLISDTCIKPLIYEKHYHSRIIDGYT